MAKLKEASYPGFNNSGLVNFAYLVRGKKVWFSATSFGTSSINGAERVVQTICEKEGIRWQDRTFYDIQTCRGYPHHAPGSFEVDRLVIEKNASELYVKGWEFVTQFQEYDPGGEAPKGIPAYAWEAFWEFIFMEKPDSPEIFTFERLEEGRYVEH